MPKDPAKNVDSYKIRGGVINEYEYHQNQQALGQNEPKGDGKLIPGMPPEEKTQHLRQATKRHKKHKDEEVCDERKNQKSYEEGDREHDERRECEEVSGAKGRKEVKFELYV